MNSRRKNFFISLIKYSLSLAVAIFLFWLVYGDFNFKELLLRFKEVNYWLIILSVVLGLLSYYLRAYRWKLILNPIGYRIKTHRAFLALMVGYFANLLLPRMGEISRCIVLRKTDSVEISSSLGSVVAERVIDLASLLLVIGIGFIIEYDKLNNILFGLISSKFENFQIDGFSIILIVISFILILGGGLFLFIFLYRKFQRHPIFLKVKNTIREISEGAMSLRKLEKPVLFWLSTIGIWALYFFMSYVVFFSFPPTVGLGVKAGISVLIMGGLGMATPVQGGVGAFHLLVSGVLMLYGIGQADGVFFAFLIHTSQFLTILIVGSLSFILSLFIRKRNSYYAEQS